MTPAGTLTDAQRAVLCGQGWLATRDERFQSDFLRVGTVQKLDVGDPVYRRGHAATHVHGLIEGQIDVHLSTPSNEDLVYPFASPGKWFCLAEAVIGDPSAATALAGTPTLTYCIPRRDYIAFLDALPHRYHSIIAHEYAVRTEVQASMMDIVTSNSLELVVRRLIRYIEFEKLQTPTKLKISQHEFAASVGLSVPTVQRAFRQLKAAGAIETHYGEIVVSDIEKLSEFALLED